MMVSEYIQCAAVLLFVSLLSGLFPGCSSNQEHPGDPVLVGAIRWDAWHTPVKDTVHGGYGGPVKAVEYALSQKQYQTRAPFFSKLISDSVIRIDGYTREIMDREINYAKAGGIDYWAFLLYPTGNAMSQGIELYLSSRHKEDVKFCAMANLDWFTRMDTRVDGIPRYIRLMKESSYQKVLGNRPLFYLFRPDDEWVEQIGGPGKARQLMDSLRQEAIRENLGDPYMVVMHYDIDVAVRMADILGADALSDYAQSGDGGLNGTPYRELTKVARSFWESCSSHGKAVIPLVMSGWNRLPRIERPVPWERKWQEAGESLDRFYALPTPGELAAHVQEACDWVEENKEACPARAILIYAWNEHDEGGWLCPTINEDGSVNNSRLEALAKIRSGDEN